MLRMLIMLIFYDLLQFQKKVNNYKLLVSKFIFGIIAHHLRSQESHNCDYYIQFTLTNSFHCRITQTCSHPKTYCTSTFRSMPIEITTCGSDGAWILLLDCLSLPPNLPQKQPWHGPQSTGFDELTFFDSLPTSTKPSCRTASHQILESDCHFSCYFMEAELSDY